MEELIGGELKVKIVSAAIADEPDSRGMGVRRSSIPYQYSVHARPPRHVGAMPGLDSSTPPPGATSSNAPLMMPPPKPKIMSGRPPRGGAASRS